MPVPNVVVRDVACGGNHTVRGARRSPRPGCFQSDSGAAFVVCSWCWTPRSESSAGALVDTGVWATRSRRMRWFLGSSSCSTFLDAEPPRSTQDTSVPLPSTRWVRMRRCRCLYSTTLHVQWTDACFFFCRGAVFLGCDQHFQRIHHVPQSCARSVRLEDPQSGLWVSAEFLSCDQVSFF